MARHSDARGVARNERTPMITATQGRTFVNLLTKDQYLTTYAHAGANIDNLPRKNTRTFLMIPALDATVVATQSEFKSTYGKKLYKCEHLSRQQFNERFVTAA
jgi:hypothetical protein